MSRIEPVIFARDARPSDGPALLDLAAACPMAGDVELCVDRAPDFFALNRLEGDRWRVGVVDLRDIDPRGQAVGGSDPDAPDGLAGCVGMAVREAWVRGRPVRTCYVGDLKVHPTHRDTRAADALTRWAREACREAGGDDVAILITVLAGNRSMQRRLEGPRGLPAFTHVGTIRTRSIPLLWRRRVPSSVLKVERGRVEDIDEMCALWRRVAPGRQFMPRFDADALARWLTGAPGLDLSCYWLARRRDGRLIGFLAFWDQHSFKQLRVTGYSRRLGLARLGVNVVAPLVGAAPLPPEGRPLRCLTATHICVPPTEAAALRALVLRAYEAVRGGPHAFLNVGLDRKDPLQPALDGLLAQPTDVDAFITTPAGRYPGPSLDGRPLHFEIALV